MQLQWSSSSCRQWVENAVNIVYWQTQYTFIKSTVLSWRLKLATQSVSRRAAGSLLHACGPATENARDPTDDDTRCTSKHPLSIYRIDELFLAAVRVHGTGASSRQVGTYPKAKPCISIRIACRPYVMPWRTGSQMKCLECSGCDMVSRLERPREVYALRGVSRIWRHPWQLPMEGMSVEAPKAPRGVGRAQSCNSRRVSVQEHREVSFESFVRVRWCEAMLKTRW